MSIFQNPRIGIMLFLVFVLGNLFIAFPKLIYHFLHYHWTRNPASGRFMYRYMKAFDFLTNAGVYDGRSDETVSSHAGRIYVELGDAAPAWVHAVRKGTEKWEPEHVVRSIEPSRPDDFDKEVS